MINEIVINGPKGKEILQQLKIKESLFTSVLSREQEINGRILKNLEVSFEQSFEGVRKLFI